MRNVKTFFYHTLRSNRKFLRLFNSTVQAFLFFIKRKPSRLNRGSKLSSTDLYIIFLPGQLGDLVMSLSTLIRKFQLPDNVLVVTRQNNKPAANLFENEFKFVFFDDEVFRPWHRFIGFNLERNVSGLSNLNNKNILIINPYTYSPIGHFGLGNKSVSVMSHPSAGAAAFSETLVISIEALADEYLAHQVMYQEVFSHLVNLRSFKLNDAISQQDTLPSGPFLLLHLETSRLDKNIDFKQITDFVQKAVERGLKVVLTGTGYSKMGLCEFEKVIYDLRGKTTFLDLAKLVQSADYVLSADTVTTHLAQLFDVKQFVILTKFQSNFIPSGLQVCRVNDFDDLGDCL